MDHNFGIYKFEVIFYWMQYVALVADQIQNEEKKYIHPSLIMSRKDIGSLILQERRSASW